MRFVLRDLRTYLVLVTGVNDFGNLLRDFRKAAGMSQDAAADAAEISLAYWGHVERGDTPIDSVSFETLWRMIEVVAKDQLQRHQLLDLAGGKHRVLADAIYSAKTSGQTVPPLDVVIETTPELHNAEDRAALKRVARSMRERPPGEVPPRQEEEAG